MTLRRVIVGACALVAFVLLVALGVWQVERLGWKRALIAQVEHRLAAAPIAAPGPATWAAIGRDDAYLRVRATGHYRQDATVFVQAATGLGSGYWVLTPLVTQSGWHVLVNRGFVPIDARASLPPPPGGLVSVTGLLRITEPNGAFLHRNDPIAGRWYSRDVKAITTRYAIEGAAPYFIDADASGRGWPRGGMTVVHFPNNHLVYAITWFGLAGLLLFLLFRAARAKAE